MGLEKMKKNLAQSTFNNLPEDELNKMGDIFVEILEENDCVVIKREGKKVDWEMQPYHKDVLKILKKTRGKDESIASIDELTIKEKKLYEKRKKVLAERFKTKTQYKMIMGIYKGGKSA